MTFSLRLVALQPALSASPKRKQVLSTMLFDNPSIKE
jgi:hypothetical protein